MKILNLENLPTVLTSIYTNLFSIVKMDSDPE